jgi:predicted esterase
MSRLGWTFNRYFGLLAALLVLVPIAASAEGDAPPDSTYFTLEAEGASVGWMSLKKTTLDSGNAQYSGSGVLQGTTTLNWSLELTGDLTRLIGIRTNMKMPERVITIQSIFKERGGEPDFELLMDGQDWSQPVEEVKAGAVFVPQMIVTALAPLSDRLAGEDPKSTDIRLHATNGAQALMLHVQGSPQSRVNVRGEDEKVRSFELIVTHPEMEEPVEITVYQRPDGTFFGVETGGLRMFATGSAEDAGPMPRVFPITVTSGEVDLRGALTMPPEGEDVSSPVAAVLMVAGPGQSGPDDQNEGFRFYAHLAQGLALAGVASLSYEPRDMAAGGPDVMSLLVADAQAALAVLSAREEIDPAKVLLLGHGEGAMLLGELAGLATTGGAAPRGLVYLGAVTIPGADLHAVVPRRADAPWLESFLTYDPRSFLVGELPPFLLLHGELDAEVPPDNATGLKTFLNETGHMRVSCTVAKNMNHYLQSAETGAVAEYPDLAPACAKGIVKRLTSFVGFCTR